VPLIISGTITNGIIEQVNKIVIKTDEYKRKKITFAISLFLHGNIGLIARNIVPEPTNKAVSIVLLLYVIVGGWLLFISEHKVQQMIS
jgi:hypothetical protein